MNDKLRSATKGIEDGGPINGDVAMMMAELSTISGVRALSSGAYRSRAED